ncbi:Altered inheritance of mitochondria protein 18 mitochondrial [Onygenales sp. PD_12]|nr:Altered inheritance of mitochondria protein 18 mitochondrial [Onygenales sp. PD_12]
MNISASLHTPLRRYACQCIRQTQHSTPLPLRLHLQSRLSSTTASASRFTVDPNRRATRAAQEEYVRHKRNIKLCATGIALCAAAMSSVIYFDLFDLQNNNTKSPTKPSQATRGGIINLDGPSGFPDTPATPTLIIDGIEQIPTGNSTIPTLPKTIRLPRGTDEDPTPRKPGDELPTTSTTPPAGDEYTLIGHGIRTVSFLNIQVYVVGLYIATADIAALQQRLVRRAATPVTSVGPASAGAIAATSLVPNEREALKEMLLDAEKGEEVWGAVLREGGVRTALRIVPTRNTDFLHLRDGWVRAITARAQAANARVKELAAGKGKEGGEGEGEGVVSEFADEGFGNAVGDFKTLFGGGVRKNVPKGQVLLLLRDAAGGLETMFQAGGGKPLVWLGEVRDERISRLVWMGYLAGKKVASEGARKSVVEGVMEIVERPVGTVEQRVA